MGHWIERPLPSEETSELFCNVCGDFFPMDSLSSHKSSAHPRVEYASSRMAQRTFLSGLPFAFLVAAIIALGLSSTSVAGVPALWVGLVALVASVSVAYGLSSRVLRATLAHEPFRCMLCGGRMPRAALATHVREDHPRDTRYLRVIGVGNRLSAFVVGGMLLLVLFSLVQLSMVVEDPRSPSLYLGFSLILVYAFAVLGTTALLGTWWSRQLRELHARGAGPRPGSPP